MKTADRQRARRTSWQQAGLLLHIVDVLNTGKSVAELPTHGDLSGNTVRTWLREAGYRKVNGVWVIPPKVT